jgi:hypothetical protein
MGYGDETLVGIAPEHFHEILTYARHISLPFVQFFGLIRLNVTAAILEIKHQRFACTLIGAMRSLTVLPLGSEQFRDPTSIRERID